MLVEIEITNEQIAGLLITAFEGGSNYWCKIDYEKSVKPEVLWKFGYEEVYPRIQWPLSEGGRIFVTNIHGDSERGYLDLSSIKRGLNLMAQDHPRHFSDILKNNEDATTADVFLQCCVFGEVVYG